MSPQFSSYLDDIPLEIIRPFRSFGNRFRLIIIRELYNQGSLSLTQIQNRTNKGTGYIIHNLKLLEMAGMVQNFMQNRGDTREYSYYELTRICIGLMESIMTSMHPQISIQGRGSNDHIQFDDTNLDLIEKVCKGLGNKFRLGLVSFLQDRESLSFSEIVISTNQEKNMVSAHLKKLENAAIIQNFFRKDSESAEYSFYELTKVGSSLIESISRLFNFARVPESKKSPEILGSGSSDPIPAIEAVSSTWALPNEPILGWIKILSKNADKITLKLPDDLRLNELFNTAYTRNEGQVIIDHIASLGVHFISFELVSQIPKTDQYSSLETVEIKVFNLNSEEIEQKDLVIAIVRPVIILKVNNRQVTQKSGLFEFSLSISKGITVQTPGVEVTVEDAQGRPVEIKMKQKDPTEMVQNIPPELKIDNLMGGFEIHGHGMLTFHFKVPYTDLKGNIYYSNEEIVKIDYLSELSGDLSYNYNFIQNTAQV